MLKRWCKSDERKRTGQRGQSFLETALVLPLVMMLFMGVIDVGFVLYGQTQLSAAAYEGARAGSLYPGVIGAGSGTNDGARAGVVKKAIYDPANPTPNAMGRLNLGSSYFIVDSDVTVSYPGSLNTDTRVGDEIVVTVSYRQPIFFFNFLPGSGGGVFPMSATARLRVQ